MKRPPSFIILQRLFIIKNFHYCFYDSRSKKVHNLTFTSPLSIVTTNHKDKSLLFVGSERLYSFAHTSVMSVTVRDVKTSKNKKQVSNSALPNYARCSTATGLYKSYLVREEGVNFSSSTLKSRYPFPSVSSVLNTWSQKWRVTMPGGKNSANCLKTFS